LLSHYLLFTLLLVCILVDQCGAGPSYLADYVVRGLRRQPRRKVLTCELNFTLTSDKFGSSLKFFSRYANEEEGQCLSQRHLMGDSSRKLWPCPLHRCSIATSSPSPAPALPSPIPLACPPPGERALRGAALPARPVARGEHRGGAPPHGPARRRGISGSQLPEELLNDDCAKAPEAWAVGDLSRARPRPPCRNSGGASRATSARPQCTTARTPAEPRPASQSVERHFSSCG